MAGSVAFMRILDKICYILHLANRLAPWRFHQHPTRLTSPTPKWKWGKC